jgi:hypothetical protein
VAAHGIFGEGEEWVIREGDVAGEGGGGREQPEDGERGGGFSGAGFADEGEGLAFVDAEGDFIYGGGGAEVDAQVFDLEERGHWCHGIPPPPEKCAKYSIQMI